MMGMAYFSLRAAFVWLALFVLCSCQSTNRLLKAGAAKPSPFLEHQAQLTTYRERLPFHKFWWPTDRSAINRAAKQTSIYIAPVRLDFLRQIKKPLPRKEVETGSILRREREMAFLLRNEFGRAFLRSPAPRYRLASKPNPESVTLELALVELNPTSPKGNAVKTGLKFVVGPIAGLGSLLTAGNIAIEGKLRNTRTGELLFEFADNQGDKMTFYSLRDFRPYGHATHAITEWANQFEEFTRTPANVRVKPSLCFTLDPL
ncbi:MAG: hypothetical protein JWO08_4342 [Verrucomicrobiaceae bacterium]|nr:hypothetical protein [Verrucomicrobiaceae bacterium]